MKAALTVSLLLTTLAAASATHAAAPAIAPPGTATLEALLACKPGSNFSAADAIDALQAAGLAKKPETGHAVGNRTRLQHLVRALLVGGIALELILGTQ